MHYTCTINISVIGNVGGKESDSRITMTVNWNNSGFFSTSLRRRVVPGGRLPVDEECSIAAISQEWTEAGRQAAGGNHDNCCRIPIILDKVFC